MKKWSSVVAIGVVVVGLSGCEAMRNMMNWDKSPDNKTGMVAPAGDQLG